MSSNSIGVTPGVTDSVTAVTPSRTIPRNRALKGPSYGSGPGQHLGIKASDLTDIDRRETTLWRLLGRYDEAIRHKRPDVAADLLAGFKRRLADYESACQKVAA